MPDVPRSAIDYDLLMGIQRGTMAYRYRGIPLLKNPFDLALYPLLLDLAKPRTLIEIGSYQGGSALWFSDQGRALGLELAVVSVDRDIPQNVAAPNITFIEGDADALRDSLSPTFMASLARPLLVVEDSSHLAGTTAAVLDFFDAWLKAGEYIVIEDGILTDMRVAAQYDGGPLRAIEAFLQRKPARYVVDRDFCDYFGRNVTWNVNGYLRRL